MFYALHNGKGGFSRKDNHAEEMGLRGFPQVNEEQKKAFWEHSVEAVKVNWCVFYIRLGKIVELIGMFKQTRQSGCCSISLDQGSHTEIPILPYMHDF